MFDPDDPKEARMLIGHAVEALCEALDGWKTACINQKDEPNIEFLAQFEINFAAKLKKMPKGPQ